LAYTQRPQKRRHRIGTVLAAGLGIILAAHLPSRALFRHGSAPTVAIIAALIVLIVVAIRFTSVRQGLIYGGILGLLAGVSGFMGMEQSRQQWIKEIDAAIAASEFLSSSSETQPADPNAAATTQPTTQPFTEEEHAEVMGLRERLVKMQAGLPYRCIVPHALMGIVVGGIFAQAAVRRRQRREEPTW